LNQCTIKTRKHCLFQIKPTFTDRNLQSMTPNTQLNNPLHGIKLADIVEFLVEEYGWDELGYRINIRCFNENPSVKSSLTFLRRTPWAREKVEQLYLRTISR